MQNFFLSIKKFILSSRHDKPHGIFLLFYPCLWGLCLTNKNILEVYYLCIIFFLGSLGMRAVGCIWNDITDKKLDILVHRTKKRLIATGQTSKSEAIIFILINLTLGIIPLFFISKFSIILCLAVIPLVITYPYMKRITWWPQLWLGINFNWGILVSYYTLERLSLNVSILLFYIGSIFLTIAYDTIYGFQDIKDDIKLGIKSTAIKFSEKPKQFLIINYLCCFLCWGTSLYLVGITLPFSILLCILFILILLNTKITNIEDPISCYKSFKRNSYFQFSISLLLILYNLYQT